MKKFQFYKLIIVTSLLIPVFSIQAAIYVDEAKKVSLFGDVRFRAESDSRSDDNNNGDTDRSRLRLRARVGVGYKANKKWSGKIRLATKSNSLNSPYKTFGTKDTDGNEFGLDQAYITYDPITDLTLTGGKLPLNFWQQNELFWDEDINPDGLGLIYKIDSVALNVAYAVLEDGNWGGSVSSTFYQLTHKGTLDKMDYFVAFGGASMSFPTPDYYQAKDHLQLSGQLKTDKWLAGIDYLDSNASVEDSAYVIQGRYQVIKSVGLSLYYYKVEAFAPLGDGTYSQDNWPNPGNTGVSNFKGFRYQFDYKIDDNTTLDIRYYDAKRIKDKATLPTTASDAIMERNDHSRVQLNLTVSF